MRTFGRDIPRLSWLNAKTYPQQGAAAYAAAYAAYAVDTPYAAWIAAAAAAAARTKILTKCAVLVRKRLKVQDTR